ncbi:hypothetical protein SCLCIDRAFT_769835 [Scleroderma citrinum Foug A]|uniref:Uncharacterized protein n=1 Tax=Scleroderma citrinum Foug A TaxID=1036808 RepID=A0A0C3AE16_9AGAM|nr:hypothetical protein SCLCIDRAFT_769835 [Scleroderma citrinum Foug A]
MERFLDRRPILIIALPARVLVCLLYGLQRRSTGAILSHSPQKRPTGVCRSQAAPHKYRLGTAMEAIWQCDCSS